MDINIFFIKAAGDLCDEVEKLLVEIDTSATVELMPTVKNKYVSTLNDIFKC